MKYPIRVKYDKGVRFNSFVIIEPIEQVISKNDNKYSAWKCKCDCGEEFISTTKAIKKGIKSCGCLSKSNRFKKVSDEQYFKTVKLSHYKNSAKRRNLEWNLSNELFLKLITGNCNYCGSEPLLENKRKLHKILLNGIDRVKSEHGYVENNVVSCCKFCNFAKGNSTMEEFENWVKRLIEYRR